MIYNKLSIVEFSLDNENFYPNWSKDCGFLLTIYSMMPLDRDSQNETDITMTETLCYSLSYLNIIIIKEIKNYFLYTSIDQNSVSMFN